MKRKDASRLGVEEEKYASHVLTVGVKGALYGRRCRKGETGEEGRYIKPKYRRGKIRKTCPDRHL